MPRNFIQNTHFYERQYLGYPVFTLFLQLKMVENTPSTDFQSTVFKHNRGQSADFLVASDIHVAAEKFKVHINK